jgi:hypothetical protein
VRLFSGLFAAKQTAFTSPVAPPARRVSLVMDIVQRAPSFKRDSPVSRGISRFPATLTVRSFPCDMSL